MALELSDLNPMTWPGQVRKRLQKDFGPLGAESKDATRKRENLNQQAAEAGGFANLGQQGYGQMSSEAAAVREMLRRRATGEDSLSAEQLRQGLQQQLAQQRSFAASASPSNAPMAARTAAINMGRASAGMAGNAALAGIAERQAAERALADMILQQRGQDAQVALGSRQNAIAGYGGVTPGKSWLETWGPAIQAGATVAALSDRRAKKDVAGADDDARRIMQGLKAYTFRYKDEKHGKGKQIGVMAQDLEKAGLKHAVLDTPAGKMVDGAKLSTANTAMIAALGKRLAKLEEGKRK